MTKRLVNKLRRRKSQNNLVVYTKVQCVKNKVLKKNKGQYVKTTNHNQIRTFQ